MSRSARSALALTMAGLVVACGQSSTPVGAGEPSATEPASRCAALTLPPTPLVDQQELEQRLADPGSGALLFGVVRPVILETIRLVGGAELPACQSFDVPGGELDSGLLSESTPLFPERLAVGSSYLGVFNTYGPGRLSMGFMTPIDGQDRVQLPGADRPELVP